MSTGGGADASPAREGVADLADLEVTYDGRDRPLRAVRGLDLTVAAGEILAVVGESGSGKSTSAMALLGLLQTDDAGPIVEGRATVLDIDMLGPSTPDRQALRRERLGAVFQDPTASLNPTMTIGRQLIEVAGSADRAEALLAAVGVPEPRLRLRSYPHEVSGGQRQRVMIAMAIAGDPALVVADEPTTALDVTIQAQMLELIRRLRDDLGCAFVVVTHDLGVAAQIADRIAVCYAGRILEEGPTAAVLARPSHPYTLGLLRSRITLRADRSRTLPTLPGEPPDMRNPPPGCPFAPRCAFHRPECDAAVPPLVPVLARSQRSACVRVEELLGTLADDRSRGDETLPVRKEVATDGPVVLALREVRKDFPIRSGVFQRTPLRALQGVDLEVRAGECVALVGESGCGKSTLLRVVAGLTEADSGDVEVAEGPRPQMVFQDAGASLTPWMSIGDQVAERLRPLRLPAQERGRRVVEALQRVGLSANVAGRRPVELSGGQRQRAALARAIVVPPKVLLCDEPTSSLDVSLAATILNLIHDLRHELGMSVLFVTHDLAAARYVADRVAVMYLGRVVEIGPAAAVTEDPQHPYTRALLAAIPDLDRQAPTAKGELPSPLRPPSGCAYHPRCAVAVAGCDQHDPGLRRVGDSPTRAAACVHVGTEVPA